MKRILEAISMVVGGMIIGVVSLLFKRKLDKATQIGLEKWKNPTD